VGFFSAQGVRDCLWLVWDQGTSLVVTRSMPKMETPRVIAVRMFLPRTSWASGVLKPASEQHRERQGLLCHQNGKMQPLPSR